MGGEPRFALNLVFFPDDVLPLEVLDSILAGGARVCREAGVAVVGGHTVRDPEPKFGLSVPVMSARRAVENRTASGSHLLTKDGTGVIGQAIEEGRRERGRAAAAIAPMITLNRQAARSLRARRHVGNNITGSGRLTRNIVRGSGVGARIESPDAGPAIDYLRAKPARPARRTARSSPSWRWEDGRVFTESADDSSASCSPACDADQWRPAPARSPSVPRRCRRALRRFCGAHRRAA
jgi:hypothetical protein